MRFNTRNFGLTDESVDHVVEWALKHLVFLPRICLEHNRLMQKAMVALSRLFERHLEADPSDLELKEIHISHNYINDDGARRLFEAVEKCEWEDHPSLKTSQHSWQSNSASVASGFEFPLAEEIFVFHSHICVDMTMSPNAVGSHVLQRVSEVGLLMQTDVDVKWALCLPV